MSDLRAALERYRRAYIAVHSAYDGECEHGFGPPATECPNDGCPDKEMADAWNALYLAAPPPEAGLREALARVMRNVVCGEWYDTPSVDVAVAAVNRLHDAEREMWALYDEFSIDPGDSYIRRPVGWRTEAWWAALDAADAAFHVSPADPEAPNE